MRTNIRNWYQAAEIASIKTTKGSELIRCPLWPEIAGNVLWLWAYTP
jgi:hypothetical protein